MVMLMLWSAPRSRSTAFYRMMIERGDFTGGFEPFSHVAVFGNAEIGGRSLATTAEVIAEFRSLAATRQVFIKDTTDRRHAEALADQRFLCEDAQHTFLIRHPRETITSYLAIRPNPRIHEMGFEAQYEVYTKVRRLTGRDPLVVDAGDLMKRPADTIKAYCAHVGIEFRPHALSWQPSDRPEWQPFRHWFTHVAASSGLAEVPSRRSLIAEQHPLLNTYLEYHLPFYQKLYQRRLVVLGQSRLTTPQNLLLLDIVRSEPDSIAHDRRT
jgi:Sulfotransferase domain